jgi:hypothetical protein
MKNQITLLAMLGIAGSSFAAQISKSRFQIVRLLDTHSVSYIKKELLQYGNGQWVERNLAGCTKHDKIDGKSYAGFISGDIHIDHEGLYKQLEAEYQKQAK